MPGVTPAFVAEATERLGARVKRSYGSTEAPTITSSTARDSARRAAETDGRPVGQCELRLEPDGELWLRGPELFAGYADAAQTRAAVTRGWFRTGDLATVDGRGWLTIVGRKKDVIIRGGENIAAAEVEDVLVAHPAIREAVAVGYPDEQLGERVCAFVVSDEPFDLEQCRTWFVERGVARFKTPEQVRRVDALPVLAAGKVDRAALRAIAARRALHADPQRFWRTSLQQGGGRRSWSGGSDDALAGVDLRTEEVGEAGSVGDGVAEAQLVELRRFRYRCRSCSHVKPMPPCTCSAPAMTRFDASEPQVFAVDAAIDWSGSSAARHQAAQ